MYLWLVFMLIVVVVERNALGSNDELADFLGILLAGACFNTAADVNAVRLNEPHSVFDVIRVQSSGKDDLAVLLRLDGDIPVERLSSSTILSFLVGIQQKGINDVVTKDFDI